ncbi:DMT family transporter [Oharaeibacter diazotrophicus]|uniref:Threonine/homoserine efflux transporter RhtA n=1 Tax=Oharaeibacter diazotrophicus TaxID=1920512 RepID=A0A4R6RBY6_9HYPH|nr:DMT family transporter [Oharaeibacter diazotrophicus]TDP83187.1 threonine/homoserine efflux transporter RhtA [Oharaeibacter diazotrophicus]BBE72016.1 inner membrane protein YtfF [Pleomorphomonas sp. SM30]GLS78781.1 membrane protein [Oharaeibacter diazotrophicus]
MVVGVLAGLFCGLLWGLTFVGPRMVAPFTAVDITVVRYALFGLFSLALMAAPRFRPVGLGRRRLVIGLALGAVCFNGYFLAVAYAVHFAGAAIPPLIVGTMPVVMAVIANRHEGTVPWGRLALPLALILAGVLAVNVEPLVGGASGHVVDLPLGLACSLAALAIWVWYGLANGRVMRAADAPGTLPWTGLQGLGAVAGALLITPLASFGDPAGPTAAATPAAFATFLVWAATLGIAGSWLATVAWVVAARRLPVALTAQLILSETVFGLIFGFLYEHRWPTPGEGIGIVLQIVGVVAAIAVFEAASRAEAAAGVPA